MSSTQVEKPVFVLRSSLWKLTSIVMLGATIIFTVIVVTLIGEGYENGAILFTVGFLAYLSFHFAVYRISSKNKVEFYNEKFKIISLQHIMPKMIYSTKEEDYSRVKLGKQLIPPFRKLPAIFNKSDDKLLLYVPNTAKKSELGGLNLLNWLKTKIPSTER